MAIFKKVKDNLANGTLLGALVGVAVVWGDKLYAWMQGAIPEAWTVLGEWSIPIYVIGIGALIGYGIDRW